MSETLATYTLELVGPRTTPWGYPPDKWQIEPDIITETEENLTDLMPEGFSVRIKEWKTPEGYRPAGLHWMRDAT